MWTSHSFGTGYNLALSNLNLIHIEESNDVAVAEKFVSSIYWQQANTLNEAIRHLFLHKGTHLIKLPMTSHTFQNKLRRSMFQASIWAQSLIVTTQVLSDPVNWDYKSMENSNNLEFDWGTQPDVIMAKIWVTFRKCNCNTNVVVIKMSKQILIWLLDVQHCVTVHVKIKMASNDRL